MARRTRRIPGQLPMFMSAREIMSTHQAADWDMEDVHGRPEQEHVTWHRKYEESLHEGVLESVRAQGVQQPVHLSVQFGSKGLPQVSEGHHRVISSAASDPERLIPVMHHETPDAVGEHMMNYE